MTLTPIFVKAGASCRPGSEGASFRSSATAPRGAADASKLLRATASLCSFCHERPALPGGRFCGRKCRQSAWRLRRRRTTEGASLGPGRFAYADPPYPGLSAKYYKNEATYAGEVDHPALIASLAAAGYVGWALSTSAKALRDVLPLCPPGARVCAWVKPIAPSSRTFGLHNTWEPLIVVGGRQLRPGKRDWLRAQPARFGGELPGRKPLAFCAWLFDCLGMLPGDELVDLFPGTGVVSRAWSALASAAPDDRQGFLFSSVAEDLNDSADPGDGVAHDVADDASSAPRGEASLTPASPTAIAVADASSAPGRDASSAPRGETP